MRPRRGIAARYIKANSSRKGSRPLFPAPRTRIAMEDAFHEINEILERKDIDDKHKAMILGENAKRFYNFDCEILGVALKMRAK
jgi:hypothetical protein